MTPIEKTRTLLICQGTGCVSSKSPALRTALEEGTKQSGIRIKLTGCHGFCQQGPMVIVEPEGIFYAQVGIEDIPDIINSHLLNDIPVERLFYKDPITGERIPHYRDMPFYKLQQRFVLRNCGTINPEDIGDYLAVGGYEALKRVLFQMTPAQVIEDLNTSALRGRGGAGFLAGRKWEACRKAPGEEKYVVCNADEGDPGAFMDRSLLEADPHAVLEGMAIAGYTVGAKQGYIYVRAEYPLAVSRLKIAIEQAIEKGFLGDNILGKGFSFHVDIFQGAGAFVCGESTALTLSIEGKRGMPKPSPRPRTTEKGLFDQPTVLNNVKTFAFVPLIINRGADWFAKMGTEKSKGTAVFALTGKVANCGLIEVPMGATLREIIFGIGGGVAGGKKFKAVQIGGPSGGCLPESLLDTPVDYDSLNEAGAMMGSGGMVILDESTCMVDVAKYFLDFTVDESCGQCIPCRVGTEQMLKILGDICQGRGREGDIDLLVEMGEAIVAGSICGLGQSAPNPVLSTIRYFRDEYEAHIKEHRCPALVCKELITYQIDGEKCKACGLCKKDCPVGAISGAKKEPHIIDQSKCTKCGVCLEVCPDRFGAVICLSGVSK